MPDAWQTYLERNVGHYAPLNRSEQRELRAITQVLVAEKRWCGCGDLEMTDEIKVTIAAQAALLLLGLEHDYYRHVQSILVYPQAYRVPVRSYDGPIVRQYDSVRLGEAWYRGPVVLTWNSALGGAVNPDDGRNVVLHEFAHKLDFIDGRRDGTPPLASRQQYRQWREVMTAEYDRLIAAAQRGRATVLDKYGASNPPEFFAVCTEAFFEKPRQLQHKHARLYGVLRGYYAQDPAGRLKDE